MSAAFFGALLAGAPAAFPVTDAAGDAAGLDGLLPPLLARLRLARLVFGSLTP